MHPSTRWCGEISIHALREEGDVPPMVRPSTTMYFYPRPPRGGRHQQTDSADCKTNDFYPRPPRGGRHHVPGVRHFLELISIHALREEGDAKAAYKWICWAISIHALREEGDLFTVAVAAGRDLFLSTPSARRATAINEKFLDFFVISIHALREEGDSSARQWTPPRR